MARRTSRTLPPTRTLTSTYALRAHCALLQLLHCITRLDGAHRRLVLHGWLAAWQLRDFDSVEAVMAHMQFLDGNASAYDEYLAWKVRHLPLAERCVSSLRVAFTPLSHADSSDCY
jgi:hypothetical protein